MVSASALRAPRSLVSAPAVITIPGIAADGSLYPIEKLEAHRLGVLHLAISAFVFFGDQLLIQRRATSKYHCAGLWANTCCTHPHWGETVEASATRRLREELGISVPLTETRIVEYRAAVGSGLTEHERVHMFVGRVETAAIPMRLDPEEVDTVRWVTPQGLRAEIARAPEQFTPWFRIYVERFPDLTF
jgi:isopentenyl-diphosphate delta-isomerase